MQITVGLIDGVAFTCGTKLYCPVILIGAGDLESVERLGGYGKRRIFMARKTQRVQASARVRGLGRKSHI